jgi:predicted membrane protein
MNVFLIIFSVIGWALAITFFVFLYITANLYVVEKTKTIMIEQAVESAQRETDWNKWEKPYDG